MNYKHLFLAAFAGVIVSSEEIAAQSLNKYGCYTDQHNQELEKMYPQSAQLRRVMEDFKQQYIKANKINSKVAGPVLKVPVVVHVLTQSGLNGMSKAQVLNGIQVLNEDFRRTNLDAANTRPIFQPYAADMEVEFVMARKDPQGNPTEGINRVTTFTAKETLSAFPISREEVKKAVPSWPTDKYFNIWLVEAWNNTGFPGGSLLGYAQFPGNGNWNNYGVVMLGNQWGKQGAVPGSSANSDGRTSTHEVGHCFSLYHTFQGGCGSAAPNHKQEGDLCGDTPPSATDTYNCNFNQNTCSNDHLGTNTPYTSDSVDQVENYMSYDNCQNMFTKDQKGRTRDFALDLYPQLQNLTSAGNATFTGIDPSVIIGPLVPTAYFAATQNRACTGSAPGNSTTINFFDASYNGPAPTAWNWSFPGGAPSSSTDQNPVVVYNTPGRYPVTLTVTNANGSSQPRTEMNMVTIAPTTGLVNIAPGSDYLESFESNFPTNSGPNRTFERYSTALDAGTPNWEPTAAASTEGNFSLRLRNSSIAVPGTVSTIITPNFDVAAVGAGSLRVSYDLAYAQKNASSNDELRFSYSTDCGKTWLTRSTLIGSTLASNGTGNFVTGTFTPSASQWKNVLISSGLNNLSSGHVMFKLEAVSKNGNTLYLDNFRVFTILGNNEDLAAKHRIKVSPNPVTTETGVSFELGSSEKVAVKIFDLIGNVVYENEGTTMSAGSHTINLYEKTKNLSAGMYMLQLNMGGKVYNTKLLSK